MEEEDQFNMSVRRFLKHLGVSSQQEIERLGASGVNLRKAQGAGGAKRGRYGPEPRCRGRDRAAAEAVTEALA